MRVKFEVDRILFRNRDNGYSVLSISFTDYPRNESIPTVNTVAVGNFFIVNVGDELEADGEWIIDKKYGHQFKVNASSLMIPATSKGMIRYLQKLVKRIGKKTATKIVNEFKEDTLKIIKNDYMKITKIKGIGEKTAKRVHDEVMKHEGFERVALFLLPLGATHNDVILAYETYGQSAVEKIKANPYILCDVANVRFSTVDKIAFNMGLHGNNPDRIRQGLFSYIRYIMARQGDLFIYKDRIMKELSSHLARFGSYRNTQLSNQEIELAIDTLTKMKKLKIEHDKNSKVCVYISYYEYIETSIIKKIKSMMADKVNKKTKEDIIDNIRKYEKRTGTSLASKQVEAVMMAINNRLSILSGGPGTGKTHTINAIINCIIAGNKNANIELCAPTGRAAKRMTELTGREAKTIHRLIGLNEFKEEDFELIPINSDFLIIDEASMVDAHVFYNLLSVISDSTQVLIVGDYEQLPSVGVGLILRDLMESKAIPTTILDEIFRQSAQSKVITNSYGVIKGNKNDLVFDKEKNGDFYFINIQEIDKIKDNMVKSIENLLKTKKYKLEDIQVLSVMNKGDLGTVELNKLMQEKFNPKSNVKREINFGMGRTFREKDRVIQTVNNYDLEVFNGEVGIISKIDIIDSDDADIYVDFGDKEVIYNRDDIIELQLAYAITVHKSQGSEFPVVVMPFHQTLKILLNRNIIYTGWTRAKEMVVCLGDINELYSGIDRTDNTVRNSQIKDKLVG